MSTINGFLVAILICGLVTLGSALGLDDPCVDPNNKPGRCIFLRKCNPLAAIYSEAPITPDDAEFISRSQCGSSEGESLFCCSGVDGSTSKLLKTPQCGLETKDFVPVGPEFDKFPWTALIQYRKRNGRTGFYCGASMINSRYVLTAAHCIKTTPEGWEVIGIRLGEYDVSNTGTDCSDGECADDPVDVGVDKIIVHEDYNSELRIQYNDIALIRMEREVPFSKYIRPICLPVEPAERSRDIIGTSAVVAGWGIEQTTSAISIKLRTYLDIVDPVQCGSVYRLAGISLRDTQLCAGGLHHKDICSGDAGGPLMKRLKSTYYIYGIASFGPNKCGTKSVPGVYTNVVKYIEWIADNLQ